MRLTKASATGNDFILIDLLASNSRFDGDRSAWVRALCDRHEGVGADGALFIEPDHELDFRWEFFNADGGGAEMCGNAARAVSLYVQGLTGRHELRFRTRVGQVHARVHTRDRIEVTLPPVGEVRREADLTFVRAGVPHAVIRVPDARDWPALREIARAIKMRPEYRAEGVNVTFFRARAEGEIEAVTFERGVEDFTLSCGTGAVAAACAYRANQDGVRVQVRVPGGELTVVCTQAKPVLIGPARLIARVDWLL